MYSQLVLDHFRNPRNVGEITDPTAAVEVTNPVCGDLLKMWIVARDGRVSNVRFKVEGCIPAIACASRLTEMMMGKPLEELRGITADQIAAALGGLPSASRHASALAISGLERLLEVVQH